MSVQQSKKTGNYRAKVHPYGEKQVYLGYFPTEEEARQAIKDYWTERKQQNGQSDLQPLQVTN